MATRRKKTLEKELEIGTGISLRVPNDITDKELQVLRDIQCSYNMYFFDLFRKYVNGELIEKTVLINELEKKDIEINIYKQLLGIDKLQPVTGINKLGYNPINNNDVREISENTREKSTIENNTNLEISATNYEDADVLKKTNQIDTEEIQNGKKVNENVIEENDNLIDPTLKEIAKNKGKINSFIKVR